MTELELLKARVAQLQQEKQRVEQDYAHLTTQHQQLRETLSERELELKLLLERFFGRKSERYLADPNQLKLDLGDSDQVDDAIDGIHQAKEELEIEVPTHRRRRSGRSREETFPDHIERTIIVKDLPDEEKEGLRPIGHDSTQTLVYKPGTLRVIETQYPKYIRPNDVTAGVRQSPRVPGLVEGNRYDTSVAAEIVASKYGYHQPVYRQQDIFASYGWTPSRSTLLNVLTSAADLIRPLAAYFADTVRGDSVIGTDDTGVTLLLPKVIPDVDPLDPKSTRVHDVLSRAITEQKKSVKAKMWAYRGVHIPLNVFDFTVSRHRDGPDLFLIDQAYEGILLGDCYGANTGIAMRSSGSIVHAACVAHARRKVRDALDNHRVHATTLLSMFGELYDIEDRGRSLPVEDRLALRQAEAVLVWDRMRTYLDTKMTNVLPKEAMATAVGYLNNQWEALTRYLGDGSIPIDNNETEQLMKQVALGRKNWMFIGSVAAGYRAADLMTLVSSAIRNDLDVWSYVKGVLDALLSGSTHYKDFLPDVWAAAHPEQIRHYRKRERDQRTARKANARRLRRQTQ